MSEKKHIDRLFQERFKDFEATPRDMVWENIEAQLNKKKKRRVIPIWWRYAGVAALLLLMLTIGFKYFNTNDSSTKIQVADTDNTTQTPNKNSTKPSEDNSDSNANSTESAIAETNTNTQSGFTTNNSDEAVANHSEATKQATVNARHGINLANNNTEDTTTYNNNIAENNSNQQNKNKTINTNDNSAVAKNNDTLVVDENKIKHALKDANSNTAIAKNTLEKSTEEETPKQKQSQTIEEALEKNKDLIEKEEELQNRWSVAPNAAPVYFNTLGNGSSIDPQFNNNSKTGNVNMSYGVSASYALNSKLTVRSGINRVNLGYNTNDVVVFQSVGVSAARSSSLQNVSSNSGSQASPSDSNFGNNEASHQSLNSATTIPESFAATNTSINQDLGYIEVPLELQYKLLDHKFGVNVIGGFSSFFLNNNEIYSEAENGNRTLLGEANNINKISYSANFGLGLNYKMTKKIDLNLEPMFKYQINTFKNTSGNFTPFFIGVYTGFAIKF